MFTVGAVLLSGVFRQSRQTSAYSSPPTNKDVMKNGETTYRKRERNESEMTLYSVKKYVPEGGLLGSISNFEYLSSQRGLERAIADGVILEAIATSCDSARDLSVDLGCMRGIIMRNEVAMTKEGESTKDIAVISRVGKAVSMMHLHLDQIHYQDFGWVNLKIQVIQHVLQQIVQQ